MGDPPNDWLFYFRGIPFMHQIYNTESLEKLEDFEVMDDDVFITTYPKSGTTWMQVLLSLVYVEGDESRVKDINNFDRAPWLEAMMNDVLNRKRPRLISSHLPFNLQPRMLREGKGKVIHVLRNPKDTLVSFYHFHKLTKFLESPSDFQTFIEQFIDAKVFIGSWFNHVRGWYENTHPNILHVTYEDMTNDLDDVIKKVCEFLGKSLTNQQVESVKHHSSFNVMRDNPKTNHSKVEIFDFEKGTFIRKGKVGDWKDYFTVAQSERFDDVYHESMVGLDLDFIWDLPARKPAN
uniref:Sulfotransferase n=1 Tax=Eptatretus burgeri TaxID=7764 RepID=A0A8C4PY78_EPTBU